METHFEQPGTLERPGPLGRIFRIGFGIACLYAIYQLIAYGKYLISSGPYHWWLPIGIAFLVFPYVINIGFHRNWGYRPQLALIALLAVASGCSFLIYGELWGPPVGIVAWLWLFYVFGHLGISFILSAILATPGCEMRAIPQLTGRMSGRDAAEHYCPGPLHCIDELEKAMRSRG